MSEQSSATVALAPSSRVRPVDSAGLETGRHAAPATRPSDLIALTKPRIMAMSLLTAVAGLALAPASVSPGLAALALLGTALIVGAANTLNMYLERDVDCLMARTKTRPLPAGRLAPQVALYFGVAQALISVPLLTFGVNPLTGLLGVLALFAYVMLYTPLKRRTTAATVIGAFPGAAPALMGWTAATGAVDLAGLAVFGVLLIWQVPHFHAIAMFRRKDYHRAGLKILPVEVGDAATCRTIAAYTVIQVALSLALVPLGVAGAAYLATAVILGVAYLGYALVGLLPGAGTPRWARNLFFASIVYLPVLYGVLVVDGVMA
jgi:heme o synthase